MRKQRTKRKLNPAVVLHHHEQEFPSRFQNARRLGKCLVDPLATQMIHCVTTHDGVEGGGFEREFPHIGRLDGSALFHACDFQVRKQSLLRTFATTKVPIERVSK